MPDTTIEKVELASSPRGEMGQEYLVAGKRVWCRAGKRQDGDEDESRCCAVTHHVRALSIWSEVLARFSRFRTIKLH